MAIGVDLNFRFRTKIDKIQVKHPIDWRKNNLIHMFFSRKKPLTFLKSIQILKVEPSESSSLASTAKNTETQTKIETMVIGWFKAQLWLALGRRMKWELAVKLFQLLFPFMVFLSDYGHKKEKIKVQAFREGLKNLMKVEDWTSQLRIFKQIEWF